MKKRFIFYAVLLIAVLSACSFGESSDQDSVTEAVLEKATENAVSSITETAAAVKTTETTIATTTAAVIVQTETTPAGTMPKAEKLDLERPDNDYMCNKRKNKVIFLNDYGRYYYVEIGGRNSANYVLCHDVGYGEPEIFTETEDSGVVYCSDKVLYVKKFYVRDAEDPREGLWYKLEDDELTAIDESTAWNEIPAECRYNIMNEHIYFCDFCDVNEDADTAAFFRTDIDGNNKEELFSIKYRFYYGSNYTVYDDKIWYEYYRGDKDDYDRKLACYDIKTGVIKEFEAGEIGLINNGYMYYTDENKIIRFNLSSYEYELVCEAERDDDTEEYHENYVSSFNFYDDYIFYHINGSLYRLSDDENTLIFSAKEFFNTDYYYSIDGIQCQDGRIFINVTSGPFYTSILEIDMYGNVIELIHDGK